MTTEEKAKAYDKAIEKIKYVMEHGISPTLNKEDLQDIFPELFDNEDEKIRKEILEVANTVILREGTLYGKKYDCKRWIAWLEKQAPKPKWTEEDEQYLLVTKNALRKYQISNKWDADIIIS